MIDDNVLEFVISRKPSNRIIRKSVYLVNNVYLVDRNTSDGYNYLWDTDSKNAIIFNSLSDAYRYVKEMELRINCNDIIIIGRRVDCKKEVFRTSFPSII